MQFQKHTLFFCCLYCFLFFSAPVTYAKKTADSPLCEQASEVLEQAKDAFDAGQTKKATDLLAKYLRKGEQHPYLYFKMSDWLYQTENYPAAEKAVREALKVDERFYEAWKLLAFCLQKQQKPTQAAGAMQQALKLKSTNEDIYLTAVFWLEAKEASTALPLLKKLEKVQPVQPDWLVALAQAQQLLQQKEETATTMEKAAKEANDPTLYFQAAFLWSQADKPQKALPLLTHLASLSKPKTSWLILLCNTYMLLKEPLLAAQIMERIIATAPVPENLYNGGVLWLQAEKPQQALNHLTRLSSMPQPQAKWFVALAQAYLALKEIKKAAEAMDKAANISQKPEHIYQAGILRLQLKEADKALARLLPLKELPHPQANWFVALSNARILKEEYGLAAQNMERAAKISKQNNHYYQAAALWLQAKEPKSALPLLTYLTGQKKPEARWFVLLSHTYLMLEQNKKAAQSMETAAYISKEGKHYFSAGILWRQINNLDKALSLLRLASKTPNPKPRWLVELADLLIDRKANEEALTVMRKTNLNDTVAPGIRYRGALIWHKLNNARQALPILQNICQLSTAQYAWVVALINVSTECGQKETAQQAMHQLLVGWPEESNTWRQAVWFNQQQGDFARAAAAMEIACRLQSNGKPDKEKLVSLYQMAGAPTEAGKIFADSLSDPKNPKSWDRLAEIYLSGQRYQMALAPALKAVELEPTAARWENIGDIYFRLRKYQKCCEAYKQAEKKSVNESLSLKKGYSLLNLKQYEHAAAAFREALELSSGDSKIANEALKNIAYIKKLYHSRGQRFTMPDKQ